MPSFSTLEGLGSAVRGREKVMEVLRGREGKGRGFYRGGR